MVTAHSVFTGHAHGQQIARSAHGGGGPLGHAREDGVEVAPGDQLAGGGVHALEALGHGGELSLQRGHVLGGVGAQSGEVLVPGNRVNAASVSLEHALRLLDGRGGKTEQHGHLAQQTLGPAAVMARAAEALTFARAHDRAAGGHLQSFHVGHRGELGRRERDLVEHRLGRAERAEQCGHRRARVLGHRVLADAAGVTGHEQSEDDVGQRPARADQAEEPFRLARVEDVVGHGPELDHHQGAHRLDEDVERRIDPATRAAVHERPARFPEVRHNVVAAPLAVAALRRRPLMDSTTIPFPAVEDHVALALADKLHVVISAWFRT